MPTQVLVFESDAAFANEVRTELTKLDCDVTVIDDGNAGIQHAQAHRPDLILLAIELPRMNGFSVCNKLKKDPGLKDVPLLILSSESSEETFDQHRKLRTRAEHYAQKPIAFGELLSHIRRFVPIGSDDGRDAQALTDDVLVVEDELLVVDDLSDGSAPRAPSKRPSLPPRQSVSPGSMDMNAFADDAFGKLQIGGLGSLSPAAPSAPPRAPSVPPMAPVAFAEEPSPYAPTPYEPPAAQVRPPSAAPPPVAPAPEAAPEVLMDAPLEVEDEIVIAEPSIAPPAKAPSSVPPPRSTRPLSLLDPPPAPNAGQTQLYEENRKLAEELATARSEIAEMRPLLDERASLRDELEDLRAKLATAGKSSGVSSREFLELRENLNKKDKEILALKENLSKKDKESIELQDRMLGLERNAGNAEERSLKLERDFNETKERCEIAEADKTQAKKVIEDTKARLERAQTEGEAKQKELAELRAKFTDTVAAHERLVSEMRQEHESKLTSSVAAVREEAARTLEQATNAAVERLRAELDLRHENALQARHAELSERYASELAGRLEEHKDELSRLTTTHLRDMEAARGAHQSELAQLAESHRTTLENVRREASGALAQRETELLAAQSSALAAFEESSTEKLRQQNDEWVSKVRNIEHERDQKIEGLVSQHERTLAQLREEAAQRVRAVEVDRDTRLAESEARAQREAGELRASATEMQRSLEARVADLVNELSDVKAQREALSAQREGDAQQARSTIANLGEQLAEVTRARDALSSEFAEVRARQESQIEQLRSQVGSLENELSQVRTELQNRIERLQAETARATRAHAKWESDRLSLERAKDALAVALQQIEETEGQPIG